MSIFNVSEMPGGEIVISRTLTEKEDGVNDYTQFLLRYDEQKKLTTFLYEKRGAWIEILMGAP